MLRASLLLTVATTLVNGLRYDPDFDKYNLNKNQEATDPLKYWGERDPSFGYTPSPKNWRVPFYTLFLDRWVNGDPTNDNANGTIYEHDPNSNQMRHGGDLQGLVDSLDYIAGMGIKVIYIAGSIFINQPWGADSYSPLDLTLLDAHFGTLVEWQAAIDAIHKKGMYVVLDHTMSTMGDLIGFEDHLNSSTPFEPKEHKAVWKNERRYLDFDFGNEYKEYCQYPPLWDESGYPVSTEVTSQLVGCYDSDFDQYGDIEAFGVHPDWQRQLAKFASVQDRLREWVPSVMDRIKVFTCITIAQLDIDGFRIDKGVQVTVDAQATWSQSVRECAAQYNKTNFFIPGEITSGNTLGSIYLGRGRRPDMLPETLEKAMTINPKEGGSQYFLRKDGLQALDAGAFHYSIYRFMTRFLGMSGNLEAGFDLPLDWIEAWNQMLLTNDMYNVNGYFDPRHMFGATNQDVFRWPAIHLGIERQMMAYFIITFLLPGIPKVYYGEEQAFYSLDGTADNYVYGRQAMSPALAWQTLGCYQGNSLLYVDWPVEKGREACHDDTVSYDHRDPSHPVRNVVRRMFQLRAELPGVNDGWLVDKLANKTEYRLLSGSTTPTEFGIWSVVRGMYPGVQNDTTATNAWLVYHNEQNETSYTFDCANADDAFSAPFDAGIKVKNLFAPYDTITLKASARKTGLSATPGCHDSFTMAPFEFRLYVPDGKTFVEDTPVITKFVPGHDHPVDSDTLQNSVLPVALHFSQEMDCDTITEGILLSSVVEGSNGTASLDKKSAACKTLDGSEKESFTAAIPSVFEWSANLVGVSDGIHSLTVSNVTSKVGKVGTGSIDKFLVRVGKRDNPLIYPRSGNYSRSLLTKEGDTMYVNHRAPGASKWRYSTNWGSSWSEWSVYKGGASKISNLEWHGSKKQEWDGDHVMVQYWSSIIGSSSYVVHGDSQDYQGLNRKFPHMFLQGPFNKWGYDSGVANQMKQTADHSWELHYMDEWPTTFQFNVWGINPDNQPDQSFVYGNITGRGFFNRVPPNRVQDNVFNITGPPPMPALSFRLFLNDQNGQLEMRPIGNMWVQILLFILLAIIPVITACLATWIYFTSFYQVKHNRVGTTQGFWSFFGRIFKGPKVQGFVEMDSVNSSPVQAVASLSTRKSVLIATMEYNIDDWDISIKIGGLGVMAKLMSTALPHLDLVWVVPVVGDVEYPIDQIAEPMFVQCLGQQYEIQVQYHKVRNITYVILDAPIFRKQTKANPYHPRMDDIESAILYAAWNACIAETIRRFPVDLYHINDYHGAAAPLYLLPRTIPVCMSLHNAEFQGMWPMRTPEEAREVCEVFDLPPDIVKQYVQYGSVFNLLHAGASYIRIHQRGFGAVGVSKKYGDRSLARYPIFWSLDNIGHLPNPDPSDTGSWNPEEMDPTNPPAIDVDPTSERRRAEMRQQAQEWAGLEINPDAQLFVFAGRWSLQKGVDLIADVFPSILAKFPQTQLICVGPVIDLYGKFSALKLNKLVQMYPGRVFVKAEFTALPPCVFSGAEFALIPSRDEPFGLVAVEFGRKGAIGVGARVGGLGQMPGFWYTIESNSPAHLLKQFKKSILAALDSKPEVRAQMRAWSLKQRFPVAQWVQRLDHLQAEAIKIHSQETTRRLRSPGKALSRVFPASSIFGGENSAPPSPRPESPMPRSPLTGFPAPGGSLPTSPRSESPLPLPPGGGHLSTLTNLPPGVLDLSSRQSTISGFHTPRMSTLSVADSFSVRAQEDQGFDGLGLATPQPFYQQQRNSTQLSLQDVVGDRSDLKLQQTDADFTDSTGELARLYEEMLDDLNANNSQGELCIATFLKKSEKQFFGRYRDAKLGLSRAGSPRPGSRPGSARRRSTDDRTMMNDKSNAENMKGSRFDSRSPHPNGDEFRLGEYYQQPKGLKRLLSLRVGDWPVYSFFLAAGQVISANSYQIVLLTGETGQASTKLYIVAGTYVATSIAWWLMVRNFKAVYALSLPWLFYGFAFLLLGVASFIQSYNGRGAVQDVATVFYAMAASSGALNFSLNFGDESGAPAKQWALRALIITGASQLYSSALWYWGALMSNSVHPTGSASGNIGTSPIPKGIVIAVPIAVMLWSIGFVLFKGLPDYYRQSPETIPGFYLSLFKRKIVPWFFVMVVIQNYWMSAPYGRSWQFLFSSQHIPAWGAFLLALFFFIGLWSGFLYGFSRASASHPWILPIFAIGLGAPRWAQTFWGTSGIAMYLPWAGGPVGSAILSRCLWLWLGLLDTVQGVGIGMTLLATLTRQHVMGVLIGSQVIGGAVTMLARATSPNAVSPSTTFPDFSQGISPGISQPYFWVALIMECLIPLGFFKFFRKEQVIKP
ncbi:alpha amylase [Coniochaeta sp. 2T2.1]|nr:alpha amylase [Coniochaeta sp. 2T2.1]